MRDKMKESDWKVFKKIKEQAIEKYCAKCFCEFRDIMADDTKTVHERYGLNYEAVRKKDKRMAILFDGQSRSGAMLQLFGMRKEGLVDEAFLEQLSVEFRDETSPNRFNQ